MRATAAGGPSPAVGKRGGINVIDAAIQLQVPAQANASIGTGHPRRLGGRRGPSNARKIVVCTKGGFT